MRYSNSVTEALFNALRKNGWPKTLITDWFSHLELSPIGFLDDQHCLCLSHGNKVLAIHLHNAADTSLREPRLLRAASQETYCPPYFGGRVSKRVLYSGDIYYLLGFSEAIGGLGLEHFKKLFPLESVSNYHWVAVAANKFECSETHCIVALEKHCGVIITLERYSPFEEELIGYFTLSNAK